ncbi:hypothetical protein [Sphingomonas sp. GC_Shp_3]|uniref:hypothetical protein n=1 Tax=Sphingomonas sp. GC_Shp_3 TaxID=2937383 RepID=UPI00226A0D19|nr:hypothetical protein [Sphingomonas sp. GC_Shp_3]
MSRAVQIDATREDVVAMCAKRGVTISAIESLVSGGTRVVLNTGADAEIIRTAYRTKIITAPVVRAKWAQV